MSLSGRTKNDEWRNTRDGNTGIAVRVSSPLARSELYFAIDISLRCHSRNAVKRKKISSTGSCRQVSSMPCGRTSPLTRSRTWS
jgi:hypothetical protein